MIDVLGEAVAYLAALLLVLVAYVVLDRDVRRRRRSYRAYRRHERALRSIQ